MGTRRNLSAEFKAKVALEAPVGDKRAQYSCTADGRRGHAGIRCQSRCDGEAGRSPDGPVPANPIGFVVSGRSAGS